MAARGYRAARARISQARQRFRQWRERRRQRRQTPEQRLDRAVSRIRPRVARLLDRGVREVVLRGALLIWRAWYRLRALYVRRTGRNIDVIAEINPRTTVMPGVVMDGEELLIYLGEVAREVLTHPRVRAEAGEIGQTRRFDERGRAQYTVSEQHGLPSLTRAATEMQRGAPRTMERVSFEGTSPATVARYQTPAGSMANKLVYGVTSEGRLDRSVLHYLGRESFASELDGMGPAPLVAAAMATWIRERRVPLGFERHAGRIAQIATTMVVQEGHRNPAALATVPMVMDVARTRGWRSALPLFPMRTRGAAAEARDLAWYLAAWEEARRTGGPDPRLYAGAQRAMNRELQLIRAWLRTLNNLEFDDQPSLEQRKTRIKQAIRDRVFRAYGIEPVEAPLSTQVA
jgi:hypothetical protein